MKKYIGKAVHCKTEELANEFLAYASSKGWNWADGDNLTSKNEWKEQREETCYYIYKKMSFSDLTWAKTNNYEIIEFKGVKRNFTLNDIKNGYNMTMRNGDILFMIGEEIKYKDGTELEYFDQNLKNHLDKDYDIVKVYDDNFKLVYTRPEEPKRYILTKEDIIDLVDSGQYDLDNYEEVSND